MLKSNAGAKRLALEKEIKKRLDNYDVRLICNYIESLEDERYKTLLNTTDEIEMSLLIGELRSYRKLLSSLSINEEVNLSPLK